MNQDNKVNRRQLLRNTGIALAASSGASYTVGASSKVDSESPPADYHRSLELRRHHDWSVSEWRDYLADHGADVRVSDTAISVSTWGPQDTKSQRGANPEQSSGDDTSTKELSQGDVTLSMTYVIWDGGYQQIDFDWLMDPPGTSTNSINEATNPPRDVAAIGWSDIDYVKDGDTYFDGYGFHLSHQNSVTTEGVAIGWNDASAGLDAAQQGESTAEGWFGVPIQPRTGSDPDQRRIFVDYYHIWLVGEINGISFGSGGPAISFSLGTQKWVKEDDEYEKNILQYNGGP